MDGIVERSGGAEPAKRTFSAGVASVRRSLTASGLRTVLAVGLVAGPMLPLAFLALRVAFVGDTAASLPFESALRLALAALVTATLVGTVAVTVDDARRRRATSGRATPERANPAAQVDAWHAGALAGSLLFALAVPVGLIVVGWALGLLAGAVLLVVRLILLLIAGYLVSQVLRIPFPTLGAASAALFRWLIAMTFFGLRRASDQLRGLPPSGSRPKLFPEPMERGASSHFNADGWPKREYEEEWMAIDAADEFFLDRGERMNAYLCEEGDHWHIGHAR